MSELEKEFALKFPNLPFPRAGKITQKVLDWADNIIMRDREVWPFSPVS